MVRRQAGASRDFMHEDENRQPVYGRRRGLAALGFFGKPLDLGAVIALLSTPATRVAAVLQAPAGQMARVLGARAREEAEAA